MATLLEELSQLISALDENEIEYAVCGGLASTIRGFPRATFDIDTLIRAESLEKLARSRPSTVTTFEGLIFRSRKEPSKLAAFQRSTMTAKLCRSIFCWLRRMWKTSGRHEKNSIGSIRNYGSFHRRV